MNVVGKVGSFFATPFHPFGGAVDIIVVKQQDGTFRSTPWYVRFGKFQGVLKGAEKVVRIEVNGVEADFHMYLDNSGEAYFVREDNSDKDKTNESLKDSDNLDGTSEMNDSDQTYHDNALTESSFLRQEAEDLDNIDVDVRDERVTLGMDRLERTESDTERMFYEFQDEQSSQEGSSEISEYGSSRYDNLDSTEHVIESENLSSEVVLVSVDGHVLTAPISSENLQENTPKSNVSQDEGESEGNTPVFNVNRDEGESEGNTPVFNVNRDEGESEGEVANGNIASKHELQPCEGDDEHQHHMQETQDTAYQDRNICSSENIPSSSFKKEEVFKSCLELPKLTMLSLSADERSTRSSSEVSESPHESSPLKPKTNDESEENVDERCLRSSSQVSESPHESSPLKPYTNDGSQENDDEQSTRSSSEVSESPHESSPLKPKTDDESEENADKRSMRSSSEVSESPHESSPLNPKTNDENEENADERSMRSSSEVSENPHEISPLKPRTNDDSEENAGEQSMRSSSEVSESPHESSPLKPKTNDESEEHTGSPPSDSIYAKNTSLPELRVEVAADKKDAFGKAHVDSDSSPAQGDVVNNQDSEKQKSVEEVPTSTDECSKAEDFEPQTVLPSEDMKKDSETRMEISLCGNSLYAGMGLSAAEEAFNSNIISAEEFKLSPTSIVNNENLILRVQGKYLPRDKAAPIVLAMAVYGMDLPVQPEDAIPVEQGSREMREDESGLVSTPSGRRWRLWPIPFRKVKTLDHSGSNSSNEEIFVDSESISTSLPVEPPRTTGESPRKQLTRTNVPTTDQIASLNLQEGQNMVNFVFSTRVLGCQKVEAHIYLWKWNTQIVISDVDGTITRSDVLGQFMPLVGRDWTHSGIARLFCAIKENGYQLLFLSARAIVQSYLTKSFLFNLKQDGKSLPTGPVVISPDGLFPSLFREVIRRAPHEFKIACLEDIKALFPPGYNPFYAGFGNRDTDELSYRKIGIPKGKIFIINPKGEVAINNRIDVKSYTSLHTLVHDMFPPTSLVEQDCLPAQEDFNQWNYWKMPLPSIDD